MLPTESLDGKPSHITPCHTERSKPKSLKGCKKKQLTLPTKTRGNSHEIDCRRSFKDFFFKMPPHYLGKYEIPNFLKNRALNIFSKICLRIIFVKWVGWESILAPEGISSTGRSVADVARQKQGGCNHVAFGVQWESRIENWVVATQIFFIFTPNLGEMIHFD